MNIIGLGLDIVETARIAALKERFGDHFLQRIFTPAEIAYTQEMKNSAQHLAARFAAKEAVSKALGTGIGADCAWLEVEIVRVPGQAPRVVLHGQTKIKAEGRGIASFLLSLTHTDHYAAASVAALGSGVDGH